MDANSGERPSSTALVRIHVRPQFKRTSRHSAGSDGRHVAIVRGTAAPFPSTPNKRGARPFITCSTWAAKALLMPAKPWRCAR